MRFCSLLGLQHDCCAAFREGKVDSLFLHRCGGGFFWKLLWVEQCSTAISLWVRGSLATLVGVTGRGQ